MLCAVHVPASGWGKTVPMICPDCKRETGHDMRHADDNPACLHRGGYIDPNVPDPIVGRCTFGHFPSLAGVAQTAEVAGSIPTHYGSTIRSILCRDVLHTGRFLSTRSEWSTEQGVVVSVLVALVADVESYPYARFYLLVDDANPNWERLLDPSRTLVARDVEFLRSL